VAAHSGCREGGGCVDEEGYAGSAGRLAFALDSNADFVASVREAAKKGIGPCVGFRGDAAASRGFSCDVPARSAETAPTTPRPFLPAALPFGACDACDDCGVDGCASGSTDDFQASVRVSGARSACVVATSATGIWAGLSVAVAGATVSSVSGPCATGSGVTEAPPKAACPAGVSGAGVSITGVSVTVVSAGGVSVTEVSITGA
jgi:hypothetical protein